MEQTADSTPAEHPSFEIGKDAANSPILSTSVNLAVLESSTSGLVPTSVPITPQNDHQSRLGVAPNAGKDTIPENIMTISEFEDWILPDSSTKDDFAHLTPSARISKMLMDSAFSRHLKEVRARFVNVNPREPTVNLEALYGFEQTLQIPNSDGQITEHLHWQPERVQNQPISPSNLEAVAKRRTSSLPPIQSKSLISKVSKTAAPNAAIPSKSVTPLVIEPTTEVLPPIDPTVAQGSAPNTEQCQTQVVGQDCKNVTKEVPREVCLEAPQEICENVPVEVCQPVRREKCESIQVPKLSEECKMEKK